MSSWMRVLVWAVGGVAALSVMLWVFQRRLIYLPGDGVPPVATVLPGWNETTIATSDGEQLGVWYALSDGAPIVVVFNGNAGTRADRAPLGEVLRRTGHGVVLFDYRGYGDSTGSPSEHGLARDAEAVRSFAEEVSGGSSVVYFGESLGAAVAIGLASSEPPAALILRSPFASLAEVAAVHYPLPAARFLRDRYPSESRIARLDAPVLVVAGSEDSIVPTEQSRRVHAAARGPKELVIVDGADPNDSALLSGEAMIDATVEFIRRHTG